MKIRSSIHAILVIQFVLLIGLEKLIASHPGDETTNNATRPDWYKGNLHTHSLWSDGNDFPDMITKWYADRNYHFLAMTDHNILSRGEKWMEISTIEERGGATALAKYKTEFGDQWVETRDRPATGMEVRLKQLEEYRGRFEQPGSFLLMTGEEISDSVAGLPVHMNATNLKELIRPAGGATVREAMANNLRSAIEQSRREERRILVHLNHPNYGWAITAEDLAFVTDEKFFEIYNGHPSVNQLGDRDHPAVERIWDIANAIRIDKLKSAPLMGLATDDSHYYHGRPGSQPGRGWVMVRSTRLTSDSILESMDRGDFYASSGVILRDVCFDPETNQLRIQIDAQPGETYTTRFVGTPLEYDRETRTRTSNDGKRMRTTRVYSPDVGRTLAAVDGESAAYQLTGDELYVRAVITSSADHENPSFKNQKKQAWCQPVGWESHVRKDR